MGKQKRVNFSLTDAVGPDLNLNPAVQQAKAAEALRLSQDTLSTENVTKPTGQFLQYDKQVYDDYLEPGQHNQSPEELDYQVAENQSGWRQTLNGFGRLAPLTASKFLGQIVGVGQAIDYATGNKQAFDEGEFSGGLKAFEENVKSSMPIYATRQYDGKTLLEQMGTAKFWADDMGDGVAFLAAQILGTKGLGASLGAIGKGASLLVKGTQAAQLLEVVPGAAKIAKAIANNYTVATAGIVNAGFSGALQAQDTHAQIKQGLQGKVNLKTGLEYTPQEITSIASDKAANTFNATFLTHIIPAMWESKIFLGLNKAKLGDLRSAIVKAVEVDKVTTWDAILQGVGESALQKTMGKSVLRGLAKGAAIEGLWEENIEQSIQKYDIQTGLNDKNVGIEDRAFNYGMGLLTNLGTKEDSKAVVLGMLLGSPMGGVEAYSEISSHNKAMPQFVDSLRRSDAQYMADIKSIYKTHKEDVIDIDGSIKHKKGELIINEVGEPEPDLEAQKNLVFQSITQKQLFDKQTLATLSGNTDMATLNENVALSAAVFRELETAEGTGDIQGALDFLKWRVKQQITEQGQQELLDKQADESTSAVAEETSDGTSSGDIKAQQAATEAKAASKQFSGKDRAEVSKAINENIAKLDDYAKAYRTAADHYKNLVKPGQKPDRFAFNRIIQKGLFYEAIKRNSIDEMVRSRRDKLNDELADVDSVTKEIESLHRLRQESLDKSKAYLFDSDTLYKAYNSPQSKAESLGNQMNTKLKKDATEEEKSKNDHKRNIAKYELDELSDIEGLRTEETGDDFKVRLQDQNEEILTQDISERVDKPVGSKNEFYWNAAHDYEKMFKLNKKIDDYEAGNIKLKDVLNYAKEEITSLDADTARRLNSLIVNEESKVSELDAKLADPALYEEEEDEDGLPIGFNPEIKRLLDEKEALVKNVEESKEILSKAQEASELNLINNRPENVGNYLVSKFAKRVLDKGSYILGIALNSDDTIREDFVDTGGEVDRAIRAVTIMRDSIDRRVTFGELKSMGTLLKEANIMLQKLEAVKEQSKINSANREAKQEILNFEEANTILDLFLSSNNDENEPMFSIVDKLLNGTLRKNIEGIRAMQGNKYEATLALLHLLQKNAVASDISNIKAELAITKSGISATVAEIINESKDFDKRVAPTLTKMFAENPQGVFTFLWKMLGFANKEAVPEGKDSFYNQFKASNDISKLEGIAKAMPESYKEFGMPVKDFVKLISAYRTALAIEKFENNLAISLKPLVSKILKYAPDSALTPTTQQEIAIRQLMSWNSKSTTNKPFGLFAFLRGTAGTGKTNIVLKWFINNSGIDKSDIITTALTERASKVAGNSTGSAYDTFDNLKDSEIPANIKLIVIDEYATIPSYEIKKFETKLRGKGIKVLLLGDPTQLTPRVSTTDDITSISLNSAAGNITIINPLTVVYRSDVSAINEASSLFSDNDKLMNSISVRADRDIGQPLAKGVHTSAQSSKIADIIKDNISEEENTKTPPRTRVIIVANEEQATKYQGLGAEVITVYNAQSETFDEVYVDLAKEDFKDPLTFNTAMYTAASRAKLYSFLTYPEGKNQTDSILANEFDNNKAKLNKAKSKFIQAKTLELAMMEGLEEGITIKDVVKDKETKEDVENAGKSDLEIEVEKTELEETPELIAEAESEETDEPLEDDMPEEAEADTELPAQPAVETLVTQGYQRAVVDYVQKGAYDALKAGKIAPGSSVVYVPFINPNNGELTIDILAQSSDESPISIGRIFKEQIESDPKYAELKSKIKVPLQISTEEFNSGAFNKFLWKVLKDFSIKNGTIGKSEYLRFLFKGSMDNQLADKISGLFSKFYGAKDSNLSKKVKFKIFTTSELSNKNPKPTANIKAGIPYAIVGENNGDYSKAMFVRLQAKGLSKDSSQIQALSNFYNSVTKAEKLTGITMGSKEFNSLVRVFRNSLEIKVSQKQNATNTGLVYDNKVVPLDFTHQQVIEFTKEQDDKEDVSRKEADPFHGLPDAKIAEAISSFQDIAIQVYGIKTKEGTYTEEDLASMDGYEKTDTKFEKKDRKGNKLYYAKGSDGKYKKEFTLSTSNGVAQLALDQIARANEFAGSTRIRVRQYLGKERSPSYKGKSLISAEGGSSKVYGFIQLGAKYLVDGNDLTQDDKLQIVRELIKSQSPTIKKFEGEDVAITVIKSMLNSMLNDSTVPEDAKQAISKDIQKLDNTKEVLPLTLSTLKLICDPENFSNDGTHKTKDKFKIKDRYGKNVVTNTHLRTPLSLDKFNALGEDPRTNDSDLSKLVSTKFSGVKDTKIWIDEESSETAQNIVEPTSQEVTEDSLDIEDTDDSLKSLRKERRSRLAFNSTLNRFDKGLRIPLTQAIADLKRMLPGITGDEFEFLSKSLLNKLANPNEDLYGLYKDGKLFVEANDKGVYNNVLRHEIMHKIFYEYLSNSEKSVLRKQIDPDQKYSAEEFDEALSDTFMEWRQYPQTVWGKLKNVFNRILTWLNIHISAKSQMEIIFNGVEEGKYVSKVGPTPYVRKAFSDIPTNYKNVESYRKAVNMVLGVVNVSVMNKAVDKFPLTLKEGKEYTRKLLLKDLNDCISELNEEGLSEEDKNDILEDIMVLNNIFPKKKDTDVIKTEVFDQLWKDLYPSFTFKSGDSSDSFEDYSEEIEDLSEVEAADIASKNTGISDHTLDADQINKESKISDNVKNFLSFIFVKDVDSARRINPRYAYLECLRVLNSLSSGLGLNEQILEAAKFNEINMEGNSDAKHIVNYLTDLVNDANKKAIIYTNKEGKSVQIVLSNTTRFINNNLFAYGNQNIDSATEYEIRKAKGISLIERQQNETTPQFIKRVAALMQTRGTELPTQHTIALFKKGQAQETMREVMSNFLSQRESSPMIAEEARTGKVGEQIMTLRYFSAQMYGSERVIAADVENAIIKNWLGKITPNKWAEITAITSYDKKVKAILTELGLKVKSIESSQSRDVFENFLALKNIVDEAYKTGSPKEILNEDDEVADKSEPQYYDLEYILAQESSLIDNIVSILKKNGSDERASKYTSVDGKSRYLFHNSNQALENIQRVINVTGSRVKLNSYSPLLQETGNSKSDTNRVYNGTPEHLRTKWGQLNGFLSGLNVIHKIIDHDGMRRKGGEEFAKGYGSESQAESMQRQFAYGFLNYIRSNTRSYADKLKYVQYFYTISNRPRMVGAVVNVLNKAGIKEGAENMLKQHFEQIDHSGIKSYSKYKSINMEELGDAIDFVMKESGFTGGRNAENYAKLQKDSKLQKKIIDKFLSNLDRLSNEVADKFLQDKVFVGDNAGSVVNLMSKRGYWDSADTKLPGKIASNKFDKDLGYTKEQILPLVKTWVANNYINSYFLNQTVVGNFNYFKDAQDLVKRMSGVFAPGIKGLIGKYFMKSKFSVAVMSDPKMFSHQLSDVLEDTELMKKVRGSVNKEGVEKGFDPADAQAFMHPRRADNIVQGVGVAYNPGAVFKGAHYEVVYREGLGYVPFMIKYSSVVLTDELCAKFPKLKALRDAMEEANDGNGIDELLFDTGNKVGNPIGDRPMPSIDDTTGQKVTIPNKAVIHLSNENYRLQLNPKHEALSSVANPTQLGYFMNVLGKVFKANNIKDKDGNTAGDINDKAATEIYTAIAKLTEIGLSRVNRGLNSSGKVSLKQMQKSLTGPGNERISEMLKVVGYNMPNISNKAMIQIMNMFSKETVKIKFQGGKFVLQSAYGFEMINPSSERFKSLTEEQQTAHELNWSEYGQKARRIQTTVSRNLQYKKDENGRFYAEVLIDQSYANKVKAGDYLLPDMLAYRVPSTGLHSSIAVKVAGFYDSKGSNVIIAPPELVEQHGSDFDVDALYVINREIHEADDFLGFKSAIPVGYEWADKGWKINKKNWEDKIAKLRRSAGADLAKRTKVDKLEEMFLRNIIVENFINVVSHPLNKQLIAEPISTQVISDAIKELGLEDKRRIDLSNPLDNLVMFSSNFQGLDLVGTFANGVKSLAYMLKAGKLQKEDTDYSYPKLHEKELKEGEVATTPEALVTFKGKEYRDFKEDLGDGKNIWQVLDALINTAVDNVKDQLLYKINATNATGNMYVGAMALGMPLTDTVSFMLQPIALHHTKIQGKIDVLKTDILKKYNELSGEDLKKYDTLANFVKDKKVPTDEEIDKMQGKDLESLTQNELLKQIKLMESFDALFYLGNSISNFSTAVSVVQNFPVTYEEIERLESAWNSIGKIDDKGKFKTNSNFIFNIDRLFEVQPNIASAYKAFQRAKETAEHSLTKHHLAMRTFVKKINAGSGIQLNFTANTEELKNESMAYLLSTMYSEENKATEPFTYTYKGKKKILTGKEAWSQRFLTGFESLLKTKDGNPLLRKMSISEKYGRGVLQFANTSNSNYEDNIEMQEGFDALDEQTKKDLVKYAVLNFGLKFGVKNYAMYIPSKYLVPVDEYINKIDRMLRGNIVVEDEVISGELHNMKDNFLLRLAINNSDKLKFISAKKVKAIPTQGRTITIMVDGQPKSIPALSGISPEGYYYNRRYKNEVDETSGEYLFGESVFPKFIRTSDNMAFIRLNDAKSDYVYYQKVGMKNWLGGYDADPAVLKGSYNIEEYFGPHLIPVPVDDVNSSIIKSANQDIEIGSKIILYAHSNESRDQGKFATVTKITQLTGEEKLLTIKEVDDTELSPSQVRFNSRFAPLVAELSSRFNLDIKTVTSKNMPEGYENSKGLVKDKVVYINVDKATDDTPFHEISHPLILAIMDKNPQWFQNLMKEFESSEEYHKIMYHVYRDYSDLSKKDQKVEGLVTLIGYSASNRKGIYSRLKTALGDLLRKILETLGVINLDTLSRQEMADLKIGHVADMLIDKDVKIDLNAYSDILAESKQSDDDAEEEERIAKSMEAAAIGKDKKDEKAYQTNDVKSVLEDILNQSKSIIDPETNSEGQQGLTYQLLDSMGKVIGSLSRVSSALANFSLRKTEFVDQYGKKYESLTEAIVNREANNKFKGIPQGEKLVEDSIQYTKEEYITFKRSIYRQGQIKGDLIHALLQYQTALMNNNNATAMKLQSKIDSLEAQSSSKLGFYNWVIKEANFKAIMRNAGIVIDKSVPRSLRDTVLSEVSVASEILGIAGKIDTLVQKNTNRLKVIDYKTGHKFNNDKVVNKIMNYGNQEFDIYDSPMGRAKLQTMIYSLIIKVSNPDARLDPPVVMHIPDEARASSPRNAHTVEVRDYLKMMESYYKNEEPEIYKKIMVASPNAFNPSHYGSTLNTSFTQDMIDNKGIRDVDMLRKYQIELEILVNSVKMRSSEEDNYKSAWFPAEAKKRDLLVAKIAQAASTGVVPANSQEDYEIKNFTKWLGTINDTHNPYLQAYSQSVNAARARVYEEYGAIESEFDSKLQLVVDEKLGKRGVLVKALLPVDKQKLFDSMIVDSVTIDEDGRNRVKRGLATEESDKWKKLSKAEKDLIIFMREKMSKLFDEVLVSGPNAVISSPDSAKRLTKLDVYNRNAGGNFKMTKDFIPKIAITSSEVKWNATKNGIEGTKAFIKYEFAKRLSMFFEQGEEGDNQKQYGIPVKYIGSGNAIHNPDIHSSNLELAFKTYTQHMINKKHYDSVYALGDSMKALLEIQKDKNGNEINPNAAQFLEYHVERNLVGRTKSDTQDFWRKPFRLMTSSDGKDIYFSPLKAMRSINGGFAAAALWLKIPAAAKNAGQAMWAVSKESLVNSLASTEWGGVSIDMQDLSAKNHARAYKLWTDYQIASMQGNAKSHPVHVFTKTFRLFPEMSELGYKNRGMIADGGKALSLNNLSILYSYPEAMTTAILGIDAMMTMKVQAGAYKEQSMWDVYSKSIVVDKNSGEGKFELPLDFTRGKLRMGDGSLQELKGLNSLEIAKLHRLVQRVKGGYRQEERSMIESTALGEMFMLFRRWLPATIVQGWKSKYYDSSLGYLQKTDQEDVFEWQARLAEGRWRTLGGYIGNITGISKNRGYNWEDLSDLQRKNLIDAGITLSTWAITSALVAVAFADADDEDSVKKFASEMNSRLTEQWNPYSILKAATQQPAAIRGMLEMFDGMVSLSTAGAYAAIGAEDDKIYTRQGDLKGSNQVLKYIPVAAAIHDSNKFLSNTEYWESNE